MMYKTETIRKTMDDLGNAISKYMALPYTELRLHISTGNKKIGRVHNFSMAPGHTCGNCSACLPYCYDVKACFQYPNVMTARAENTAMMRLDMGLTFMLIDKYISTRKANKYFRWHVSGDILNDQYFDNMVRIARRHPDWVFWTYTKRYDIVNRWLDVNGADALPKNLSVMFSVWNGVACPNRYNMPTFTCIQDGMEPAPGEWRCPGNCDTCLRSGHGCPFRESSYVYEH